MFTTCTTTIYTQYTDLGQTQTEGDWVKHVCCCPKLILARDSGVIGQHKNTRFWWCVYCTCKLRNCYVHMTCMNKILVQLLWIQNKLFFYSVYQIWECKFLLLRQPPSYIICLKFFSILQICLKIIICVFFFIFVADRRKLQFPPKYTLLTLKLLFLEKILIWSTPSLTSIYRICHWTIKMATEEQPPYN